METFVCEHQINISMCKVHDCEKCSHKGNEASCPMARNAAWAKMPTFQEAIELFKTGSSSYSHKRNVECNIRNALPLVGLNMSSKLVEMTFDKFELLIEKLKEGVWVGEGERCNDTDDDSCHSSLGLTSAPTSEVLRSTSSTTKVPDMATDCDAVRHRVYGPHRSATIQSYLAAFDSITSNDMLTAFRKTGRSPFKFAKPKFDPPREKKQFVTHDQMRKVNIEMEKCFASGKKSDFKVALLIFFDIYLGLRVGEICHLKWGNIQLTEDGVKLIHTPRKTMRYHPDPVSIPIPSKVLAIIRPYIGKPDEDVLPLEEKYIPKNRKNGKANNFYSRMFLYSRKKANKIFENAGIGIEYKGQKKMHAGRKYRETVDAEMYGDSVSASWRGHSDRVAHQSYISDPSTLTSGSSRPLVAA